MADLPQTTSYNQENMAAIASAMKGVGQNIRQQYKSKRVDTAPYQGLKNRVQSYAPTDAKGLTVTTPYMGSTKFEAQHPGIDYSRGMDAPVQSWTGGKVAEVVTGKVKGSPSFGNYVVVIDDQGNKHRYSHLQGGYIPVSVGQQIQAGDVIGREGATGQVYSLHGGTGAHTDFRSQDIRGKYLDPMRFVNAYQKLNPKI